MGEDPIRKAASRVCRVFITGPITLTYKSPVLHARLPRLLLLARCNSTEYPTANIPSNHARRALHRHRIFLNVRTEMFNPIAPPDHGADLLPFCCSFSSTYAAFVLYLVSGTLDIVITDRTNQHGFNASVHLYGTYHFTAILLSLTHILRPK
jgi:hypothetical protein